MHTTRRIIGSVHQMHTLLCYLGRPPRLSRDEPRCRNQGRTWVTQFVAFSQAILSIEVLAIGSTYFLRINDNRLGHKAAVGTRSLLGPQGACHARRNAGMK